MITGTAIYFAPEEDDADEEDDFEVEADSLGLALWLVEVVDPDELPPPEEDALGDDEVGGLLVGAGELVLGEVDGLGVWLGVVDGVGLVEWLGFGVVE